MTDKSREHGKVEVDERGIPILFQHYWWWKSKLPERRGEACWITARGAMNTVRVEFWDGYFVFTSRFAVRKRRLV